jgi:hypothetical protein
VGSTTGLVFTTQLGGNGEYFRADLFALGDAAIVSTRISRHYLICQRLNGGGKGWEIRRGFVYL